MFQNGDLKEIQQDGVVVYHYRATGAVQTTLTDGTELYQFSDGQTERHSLDGSKEIRFPNGTTKKIFSDGTEEVCFADGTVKKTLPPK
jgi:centromere protein J